MHACVLHAVQMHRLQAPSGSKRSSRRNFLLEVHQVDGSGGRWRDLTDSLDNAIKGEDLSDQLTPDRRRSQLVDLSVRTLVRRGRADASAWFDEHLETVPNG